MRKMKDSGIEWINQVPFDWEVKKLKYCFTFGKGLSITKDNLEESGIPVISYGQIHSKLNTGTSVNDSLIRYVNESYLRTDKSALVKKNDFIFADTSEDLEGCGNCIYNDFNGNLFAGYHTIIFRSQQSNAKYFAYLFLTDCWRSQIRKVASGVKLYSITQKILKETSIIIPPLPEQKKIADFLDAKCADIDQIRADIDKQIEILTDYKKSIITEAVTKGLDPKAKMKDSGIVRIGQIPKPWKTSRIKYLFSVIGSGTTPQSGNQMYYDGDRCWIQSGDLYKTKYIVDTEKKITEYAEKTISALKRYSADFLIVAMYGASIGNVSISKIDACVNQACCVIKPNDKVDFNYLYYSLINGKDIMLDMSIGGTQPNISQAKLLEFPVLLPPLSEQQAIASFLDEKCSEIDATIAEKQKQLETLEEYKKSLIFEYVTGKKEVV